MCAHNDVRNFEFVPRIWSRPHDKDCRYIFSSSKNSFSHILTYRDSTFSFFISTSKKSLTLPVSKTQLNTRNMGAYTFCHLFLTCSALSVRLFPASNTASEISSNPVRDKQPTWERTRSSKNTLLYFYILIPRMKYLINIHFRLSTGHF